MLVRALIVVLVVLNLGVALWWGSQPAPQVPVPVPTSSPVHVARLELLPMIPVAKQVPPSPATQKVLPHCYSVGSFASETEARAALIALGRDVDTGSIRALPSGESSSYRVVMSASDHAAAQVLAKRIVGAGFHDYYVLGNEVVLGRYRNREGAKRLRTELAAAGFQANLLSGDMSRWEIHLRSAIPFAALQVRLRGYRLGSLDCATLR
ncbi:SPOR domain-containing protein [Xylella taiwanensis]|uniref:SPOR domain-containing protein n=1 Tax=Xylella taiwanensis TaxID=1444770 RepID=Z9JHN3_9GAMM|nr:SPOR domain-containing protein [Xylella taiwanensis]AXI83440.1 sporulation protein [Xylella taiwanensis]EWS77498.1 sporulation protein [Xylella taiwanensis]MCD8456510.1 SPOR domain-containing protein [Xylella taiwanensis]MCD8458917.1 SPOR domain-containing protein [Xylella taiwanensis]MCD8461055.1 SPOR domain-containing protein [Xylella taiwanensis]